MPVRQEDKAPGTSCAAMCTLPSGDLDELGDRTVEPDAAGVEHDDAVTQRGDVLGLVGGQEHGPGPRQAGEDAAQGGPLLRVEPGGGLVEDDQQGITHQGLGDGQTSPLASRERGHPLGAQVVEADELEDAPYLTMALVGALPLLEDGDVVEEPEGRHPAREHDLLREVAQTSPGGDAVCHRSGDVVPRHVDPARGRRDGGGEQPQHGRLAGAVGPEEPDDAGGQDQVDRVQCRGPPKGLRHSLEHGDLPGRARHCRAGHQ